MSESINRKSVKRKSIIHRAAESALLIEKLERRTLLTANISIDPGLMAQLSSFKQDIDSTLTSANGSGDNGIGTLLTPLLAANELPLIGSKLQEATAFLTTLQGQLDNTMQSIVNDTNNFTTSMLIDPVNAQTAVNNALGAGGAKLLNMAEPTADLVRFFNSGGDITDNTTTGGETATSVQFNLDLQGSGGAIVSAFDIGLPGLSFTTNGNVSAGVTYTLFLHLGFDETNGFYFDTDPTSQDSAGGTLDKAVTNAETQVGGTTPPPALRFTANLVLQGSGNQPYIGTGKLGPLELQLADHTPNGADHWTHTTYTDYTDPAQNQSTGFAATIEAPFQNPGITAISDLKLPSINLSGTAIVNLDAELSLAGDLSFPSFDAEFHLDWNLPSVDLTMSSSDSGGLETPGMTAPSISFTDISVNMGTFLTNTLYPIINDVYKVVSPLQPLVYFLEKPMPIVNDIGALKDLIPNNGTITVADFFAWASGESDIATFTDVLNEIFTLNSDFSSPSPVGAMINLGGFNLNTDPRTVAAGQLGNLSTGQIVGGMTDKSLTEAAGTTFAQLMDDSVAAGSGEDLTDTNPDANAPGGSGSTAFNLDFPLFDSPSSVFGLFFGQNVKLFQFNLSIDAGIPFSQSIPIIGPLAVDLHGSYGGIKDYIVQLDASLSFGYDTFGLTEAKPNPLDGFYVDANNTYLTFSFGLSADAALDLEIAELGVGGGIESSITFGLNKALAKDGDIRYSALQSAGLTSVFQVSGEVDAFLDAFYRVGIGPFSFGQDFHLADITLISFGPSTAAAPTLGTVDSNDNLTISVPDIENQLPGDHDVRVDLLNTVPGGSGQTFYNLLITASGSKTSAPVTEPVFGVRSMSITGSTEGSKITVGSGVNVPVTIVGQSLPILSSDDITDEGLGLFDITAGDGTDTISVSDGDDVSFYNASAGGTIQGGASPDTITVTDYVPQGSGVQIVGGLAGDIVTVGYAVYADTIVGGAAGYDNLDSSAYNTYMASAAGAPDDTFIIHADIEQAGSLSGGPVGTDSINPGPSSALVIEGGSFTNNFSIVSSPLGNDPGNAVVTDQYTRYGNDVTTQTFNTTGFSSVDLEGLQPKDTYTIGDLTATSLQNVFANLDQSNSGNSVSNSSVLIIGAPSVHSFTFTGVPDNIGVGLNGSQSNDSGGVYTLTVGGNGFTSEYGPTIDVADGSGDEVTFNEPTGSNSIEVLNSYTTGPITIVNPNGLSDTGTDSVSVLGAQGPVTINTNTKNSNITILPYAPINQPITIVNNARSVNGGPMAFYGTINLTATITAGSSTLTNTGLITTGMGNITWNVLSSLNINLSTGGDSLTDSLNNTAGTQTFPVTIYSQGAGADEVYAENAIAPITFTADIGASGPDLIDGTGLGDNISTGSGNDTINEANTGTGPADTLNGGAGNNTITAYGGSESINGGAGSGNVYIYYQGVSYAGGYPTIAGGPGNDTIVAVGGGDISNDCDPVIYTNSVPPSNGVAGSVDYVEGTANAATIYGGAGRDQLQLGDGTANTPTGTVTNDFGPTVIYFGTGYGYLAAGPGAETVYGGNANDEFDSFAISTPPNTPFLVASGSITDNTNAPGDHGENPGTNDIDMTIAAGATVIAGTEYSKDGPITIGSLAGAGNLRGLLTLGTDDASTTFTGSTDGFVKAGTGVFTCETPDAAGYIDVQDGTLRLLGNTNPIPAVYYSFDNPYDSLNAAPPNEEAITNDGTLAGYNGLIYPEYGPEMRGVTGAPGGGGELSEGSDYSQLISQSGGAGVNISSGAWTASLWFNGLTDTGINGQNNSTAFHANASNDAQATILKGGYTLGSILNNTFHGSAYNVNSPSLNVTTGWHQLTVVGTPGSSPTTAFYIDGTAVGSIAGESTSDISQIGNYITGLNGNYQPFATYITGVAIFQISLTLAQVQSLYQIYNQTNTIPGDITVDAGGTLDVNNLSATIGSLAGAGSVILGTGQLTTGGDNATTTFSGTINGSAGSALTKAGTGTFTLSQPESGITTINVTGGTLLTGGANTLSTSANVTVSAGAVLNLNNFNQTLGSLAGAGNVQLGSAVLTTGNSNANTTFSGVISGSGAVTYVGTGTWTLGGQNTYGGATNISAGTVAAGAVNVLPSTTDLTMASGSAFNLNSFNQSIGSLAGSGSILLGTGTLATGSDGASTTFSGVISGNGSVIKNGAGAWNIAGMNLYTGNTSINAGTLQAGIANALSTGTAVTIANGAVLDLNGFNQSIGSLAGFGNLTEESGALATGNDNTSTVYSGVISGTGPVTKTGSGTWTLNNSNLYSATTAVTGGTLQNGIAHALPTGTDLTVGAGATYNLNSFNQTIGSLAGAGSVTLGSGLLTTGGDSIDSTFSGLISGSGGLTKTGVGPFICAVPSYTGPTNIQTGIFRLSGYPNPAPAVYYSFNDPADTGSVATNDGSLAGKNGTISNAKEVSGVAGAPGGGNVLQLNNSSGVVLINQSGGSGVSLAGGAWTASLWFNGLYPPTSGSGYRTAFHSDATNDAPAVVVTGGYTLGSYLTSAFYGSTYNVNSPVLNVTTGWHQLTAVGTPGSSPTTTFYIDGSMVGSIPEESTTEISSIGNYFLNPNQTFANYIADVGIYQVSLTAAQVLTLYQQFNQVNKMPSAVTVASGATFDVNSLTVDIGSLAGSGSVTLGTGSLNTGTDNTNTTFSGVISNNGSVTKVGTGTWTVTNPNTYTGSTTLNNGTENFNSLAALGGGTAITFTGGTLQYATGNTVDISGRTVTFASGGGTIDTNGNNVSFANSIGNSGSGTFTKAGAGTLTLHAAGTWKGTTTISGGTLQAAMVNILPAANDLTINATGALDLNNLNQSIGSLAGSGTVTMEAATLTSGTGGDNNSTNYAGVISGTGTLIYSGGGVFTLSGTNAYSGGTILNGGGGISISTDANLGAAAGAFSFNPPSNDSPVLYITGTFSTGRSIFLANTNTTNRINVSTASVLTDNGVISNSNTSAATPSLEKDGGGTLVLNAANTFGANNGADDFYIAAGTVKLGIVNAIPNILVGLSTGSPITAVLDLNGFSPTLAGLVGGYSGGTQLGSIINSSQTPVTLTLDGNGFTNEYDGSIMGLIALVLTNDLQALGGTAVTASNYSGGTTVLSGLLASGFVSTLNGSTLVAGPFGTGAITLGSATGSANTTLEITGTTEYNPIAVVGGNTGIDSLSTSGPTGNVFAGLITIAHSLTIGGAVFTKGITGTGNITINNGAGNDPVHDQPTTFQATSNYSGSTNITSGSIVVIGVNNALPTSAALIMSPSQPPSNLNLANFNLSVGSLTEATGGDSTHGAINLGTGSLTVGSDSTNTSFGGLISGTGSLIKIGAGTLTLTGADSFTGSTQISGGSIVIGNGATSGSLVGSIALANGANFTFSRSDSFTYAGSITGNGSLTQSGTGTLILAAPTQSGSTTVASGTLRLASAANNMPSTVVVAFGATFDINSLNASIGSLSGAGSVLLGSGTLTTGTDNSSKEFDGIISGTGGLVKSGSGTLTLTNANTYSGSTNISAGMLTLAPQTLPTIPGPAVLYTFNDPHDSGGTVTNDGTLANKNGTFTNASETSGITGAPGGGKVLALSNVNGDITINPTNSKGVDLSGGSWTASLWFNGLYPAANYRIAFHATTGDAPVAVQNNNGNALGAYQNSFYASGYDVNGTGSPALNVSTGWHNLAAVGTGGSTLFYIDGSFAGSVPIEVVSDIYSIGNAYFDTGNETFAKYLADISIYQTALSASQIRSLYLSPLGVGPVGSLASANVTTSPGAILNVNDNTGLNSSAALVSNGTTTFAATTGTGILNRSIGSISIGSAGSVVVANAATHATRTDLITGALNFAGSAATGWQGTLDLANNDLDVQGGSLGNINSQIAQGSSGGTWMGSGGIISSAAKNDSTHLTTLGLIQNNQSGSALFTSTNLFDGTAPGASDILVKYTYYGDTDLSGAVDGSDYSRIDYAYLNHLTGWSNGDFNGDGVINGSDYTLIDNAFNTQGAKLAAQVESIVSPRSASANAGENSPKGTRAGEVKARRVASNSSKAVASLNNGASANMRPLFSNTPLFNNSIFNNPQEATQDVIDKLLCR